jgi:hypothetical protein
MNKKKKANILVLHGYEVIPYRSAVRDLLFCYREYACNARVYYLNLYGPFDIPEYILNIQFDLIIFHTVFLSARWMGRDYFQTHIIDKCQRLKELNGVKIIHPQDEWIHTNCLVDFVNEYGIDIVFSVSPESEWSKIYKGVDFKKVRFFKVLTGYFNDRVLEKIKKYERRMPERAIDIGYRAFQSPPWLGRHGFLKTRIAQVVEEEARHFKLVTDISTRQEDTIIGDDWYTFMLSCRYFIGVEGGSTVLDPDGEIWKKGTEYIKSNPEAPFKEVEEHVFPGMDGNLKLLAVSPRHLEACATKTCQILIEGDYNGILKPGIHYLELKEDFSNLNEVLSSLGDEQKRRMIVERAHEDIVESGRYSYKEFVRNILNTSLELSKIEDTAPIRDELYLRLSRLDGWNRLRKYKRITKLISTPIRDFLKYNLAVRVKGRIAKIKKGVF